MRGFENVSLLFLVLCGPSLSLFIEFAQKRIPGRVSDPLDFALNSLGYLVCLVFLRRGNQFRAL
jgi:glycopeptide antibiotics resistance protein